jgi:hypothetical protein
VSSYFYAKVLILNAFFLNPSGTVFIAGGAALIAVFGVVPESAHSLEGLIRLYTRPAFLVFISLFSLAIVVVALTVRALSHVENRVSHTDAEYYTGSFG